MKTNETQTNTALAVVPRESMTALQVVENTEKIKAFGQIYAASGFFGQVSASVATAALVNAFLEGKSPLEYRAKYHTFDNGQTGIKSDYIQREFHRLGGSWKFLEWTPEKCRVEFAYAGQTLVGEVTMAEFVANGVACKKDGKTLKENWAKFPREMLKARCMATYIRAMCPEALDGQYTQEEVADFATARSAAPSAPLRGAETASQDCDCGVCPCGSVKGKRWDELPTETLEKILATPEAKAKALTPDHRNAIVAELGRREAEMEAGEALTPEVCD